MSVLLATRKSESVRHSASRARRYVDAVVQKAGLSKCEECSDANQGLPITIFF
jgi:hypothetical protein